MAAIPREKKGGRPQPSGLTADDLAALLTLSDNLPDQEAAILLLIILGGMRVTEIIDLDVTDITLSHDRTKVRIRNRGPGAVALFPPVVGRN